MEVRLDDGRKVKVDASGNVTLPEGYMGGFSYETVSHSNASRRDYTVRPDVPAPYPKSLPRNQRISHLKRGGLR